MPEFEQPTLTVRTSYPGVGPLEIEELITRPMEQAVSAVPGIARVQSQSSEGNSQVQLNFEWGSDLSEAADEVRTRVDRMRGRLPEDADPPTIFKFDSNQLPVAQIGIEGDYDPVTLREIAQNEIAPRFERVDGVAAVTVNGGVRRQIHVELSKEKITALNLWVNTVVNTLRQENQNTPLGEIFPGDAMFLVRSQGQFRSLEDIRNLVVLTREGVPVYLRDIAEVKDTTEQRRIVHAHQRQARRPHSGAEAVGQEHRGRGRRRPRRGRAREQGGQRHQDDRHAGQLGLHRARDQERAGARDDRRHPGRADHLRLPARLSDRH